MYLRIPIKPKPDLKTCHTNCHNVQEFREAKEVLLDLNKQGLEINETVKDQNKKAGMGMDTG